MRGEGGPLFLDVVTPRRLAAYMPTSAACSNASRCPAFDSDSDFLIDNSPPNPVRQFLGASCGTLRDNFQEFFSVIVARES